MGRPSDDLYVPPFVTNTSHPFWSKAPKDDLHTSQDSNQSSLTEEIFACSIGERQSMGRQSSGGASFANMTGHGFQHDSTRDESSFQSQARSDLGLNQQ